MKSIAGVPTGPDALPSGVPRQPVPGRPYDPDPSRLHSSLVSLRAPTSYEAGQYRSLGHQIQQRGRRVLAVGSPGIGDGKTTTAVNLAVTLAETPGRRVLLVDTDLRKASVGRMLALPSEGRAVGLADILVDDTPLERVAYRMADGQLAVVAAGDAPVDPYRLLQSDRFRDFVLGSKHQFNHVVLDIPPILPVPDWRLIGTVTDGFLLVVGAHHTPRRMLEETLGAMDPDDVIGIVFNAADRMDARYAAYYAKAYRANGGRAAPNGG